MPDHFEFLQSICDTVFDRYDLLRFGALTEAEQTFVCLWALKGEVDNGGFDQFYFNSSGDLAVETVTALERVGAVHTAELMRKANGFFENASPPKDRDARVEQLDSLTESDKEKMGGLDDIFYQNADSLDDLLYAFVLRHRGQFLTP